MKSRLRTPLLTCLLMFGSLAPSLAESTIGRKVAPFSSQDFRGKEYRLDDLHESKLVVVAFLGTQCPLAKLYSVRLQQIADEYADRGVSVIGVNSNVQDSLAEIGAFVRQHELKYPMLKDAGHELADAFGAERTPEVFVLDQQRVIRYRGRVDDQYVVGITRDHADREDLKLAIDDLLAGRPVVVAETKPLGCIIGRARRPDDSSSVTYSNQIARIFQDHCVECHRDGEIAPFTLTSYDDAAGWGEMIAEVVAEQRMPPWNANPKFGHFSNDRSLTAQQRQQIATWVEHGCPEGNRTELPAPREFVDGWNLSREPDLVVEMRDRPFHVPAEAGPEGVAYQNFWVDPKFTDDKWITAAEVRPGNRAVVHHIIVYAHPEGKGRGENSFLAAYVPGLRPQALPTGAAKKIPAGSWFRFQVHYTPIGTAQDDLSKVGFIFTDEADITHEVRTTEVANAKFQLEPFKDNQEVTARSQASPVQLNLLSMSPHMHLRGKSFRYDLVLPDGTQQTLLDVPRYDFNWQTQYRLAEPLIVPAGARLAC
ncbi:MAG: redoxin domain-containing protein, partial [Planctomycetaceae bacterium]|nr:redoxin domain-containing protein [Planctomycetaceae bacterium]